VDGPIPDPAGVPLAVEWGLKPPHQGDPPVVACLKVRWRSRERLFLFSSLALYVGLFDVNGKLAKSDAAACLLDAGRSELALICTMADRRAEGLHLRVALVTGRLGVVGHAARLVGRDITVGAVLLEENPETVDDLARASCTS